MSKSKISESKRIQSNLLQQNCYVRDVLSCEDLQSVSSDQFYESVDESTLSSGIKINHTIHTYPITVDYVNSFVESSDYRVDPLNAISNGVHKQNLGDVGLFQQVASMDMEQASALYKQLQAKFSQAQSAQPVSEPVPQPIQEEINNV